MGWFRPRDVGRFDEPCEKRSEAVALGRMTVSKAIFTAETFFVVFDLGADVGRTSRGLEFAGLPVRAGRVEAVVAPGGLPNHAFANGTESTPSDGSVL